MVKWSPKQKIGKKPMALATVSQPMRLPEEFKVLNLLAKKGGAIDRGGLSKILHVDPEVLNAWLRQLPQKKAHRPSGNYFKLHFQQPKFCSIPETKLDERLVTKPYKDAILFGRHFIPGQIERPARSLWSKFRHPYYDRRLSPCPRITVQNPDGSVHTSHWNAMNGKRLSRSQFID